MVFGGLPHAGSALLLQLPGGDTAISGTAAGIHNQQGDTSMLPFHTGRIILK